jgi:hypothetical protein
VIAYTRFAVDGTASRVTSSVTTSRFTGPVDDNVRIDTIGRIEPQR